jgi:hypothetical protein
MSTGLLMASGMAIMLVAVAIGMLLCTAVESWKRRRRIRARRGQLVPLRRRATGRRCANDRQDSRFWERF